MGYNTSELIGMSNSELLELMKGLSVSDRRDIWNAIADSDVSKICDFSTDCKNTKISKVLTKGKRKGQSVSVRTYDEFCEPMFSLTIRNAWDNERNLIRVGKGTQNWIVDEQRIILN